LEAGRVNRPRRELHGGHVARHRLDDLDARQPAKRPQASLCDALGGGGECVGGRSRLLALILLGEFVACQLVPPVAALCQSWFLSPTKNRIGKAITAVFR
jgi:hypothetical protein